MLYPIGRGDPSCEIGVAFELATVLGVTLFEPDLVRLQTANRQLDARLALLPKAIRTPTGALKDAF